jgi:hypothetical protein
MYSIYVAKCWPTNINYKINFWLVYKFLNKGHNYFIGPFLTARAHSIIYDCLRKQKLWWSNDTWQIKIHINVQQTTNHSGAIRNGESPNQDNRSHAQKNYSFMYKNPRLQMFNNIKLMSRWKLFSQTSHCLFVSLVCQLSVLCCRQEVSSSFCLVTLQDGWLEINVPQSFGSVIQLELGVTVNLFGVPLNLPNHPSAWLCSWMVDWRPVDLSPLAQLYSSNWVLLWT